MTQGLQVFDGNGNIFFDTNQFIGRYLGAVAIGTGTGTITNDAFATGIGWCIPILEVTTPFNPTNSGYGVIDANLWLSAPTYAFSGNQLVWNRSGTYPSGWQVPSCTLYYGIR